MSDLREFVDSPPYFPNRDGQHPWQVVPPRCQHDVIIPLPGEGYKGCEGCHVGLVSKHFQGTVSVQQPRPEPQLQPKPEPLPDDAERLTQLPADYTNEPLGIRNNIDALVLFEIGRRIVEFSSLHSETMNGTRNRRIADFIRRHANDYVMPGKGSFTSDHDTKTVQMRLRRVTESEIRDVREMLPPWVFNSQ